MKINVLVPFLGPGGGIRVIYEIMNRLNERHDIKLYYPAVHPSTRGDERSLWNVAKSSALAVKRAFTRVDWMEVNVPINKVPCFNRVCQPLLRRQIRDADILIATSWSTAYTADELPNSKGMPFYFMQHYEIWPIWNEVSCWNQAEQLRGCPSVAMADVSPSDPFLARYKRLVDQSYSLPLNIIRTSEWEAKVLSRLGESAVGSVSYGVDHDLFYQSTTTEKNTILALFRNSTEKGDQEAIAAFKKLHDRHPKYDYLMFGQKRPNKLPNFIEFHENPDQKMIRDLYSMSDLLIYPSWVEGYGMPPMEAMACGNAIVSTDVGAVRDYSPEHGVKFVPIRDVDSIVESVNELFLSDKINHMKRANKEQIRKYTWEQTTNQFESVILDTMDRNVF